MPTRGEIAATFDAIADEFDASRVKPWPETLTFESRLPRAARVLDLGCDGGRNLAFLRERGHTAVGLDASRALLARSVAKVGTGHILGGDAIRLPFRRGTFDAVLCVATVHHLPSPEERHQCMTEMVRVLRPGGLAILSAWALEQERFQAVHDEHLRERDAAVQDLFVPWRRSDGRVVQRFYHLFRAGELERLVQSGGLAVERAWREGDNHVVLGRRP